MGEKERDVPGGPHRPERPDRSDRPFRPRRVVLVSLAALVLAAGATVWVATVVTGAPPDPTPPRSAGPTPGVAPDDAVRAIEAFASPDVRTFRASLSEITRSAAPDAPPAPRGTSVTVDRASWRENGDDAVVRVVATQPDGARVPTDVFLVRENGTWRILFTEAAP